MLKSNAKCKVCGKPIPAGKNNGSNLCVDCQAAAEAAQELEQFEERWQMPDLSGYDVPPRSDYSNRADWCVAFAKAVNASDVHFKCGIVPHIRKGGTIMPVDNEPMRDDEIFDFISRKVSNVKEHKDFSECYDFSFSVGDSRFRGNAFHDFNGWAVALRHLWIETFNFAELGIPVILKEFVRHQSGLVLVTGPTGSGKTTSLTCTINYINHYSKRHIITLEDPIEFLHEMDKCLISQREIGKDTGSYEVSIIEALREDPDVILIGEMRDRASIETALRAAETGHLVLSTLHTRGTASTIDRIVDIFPAEQHQQIRNQLASCLLGIVSQQLVPSTEPGKRCLATEVMRVNAPVRTMIRENKLFMMDNALQLGASEGMHTMASSLEALYRARKISPEAMNEYSLK